MWTAMEAQRPTVFTASNHEGVERVKKGKGSYAFLMESTSIEYTIERNCDLTQVGGMLDSKGEHSKCGVFDFNHVACSILSQAMALRCVKDLRTEH